MTPREAVAAGATYLVIARLVDMGIEPFLVASAVDCVVGQRLARTLCADCKSPFVARAEVLRESGYDVDDDVECFEAHGCPRCGKTGYRGRIGIYEVMEVSEAIRSLVMRRGSSDEITRVAVDEGMLRLRHDGLAKVRDGVTSLSEIARVVAV